MARRRPLPRRPAARFDILGREAMKRKLVAWTLFLLALLFLSLAATPYSRAADAALISFRLSLIVILSILVVRERWRYRRDPEGGETHSSPDAGDTFLRRCRRWYRGE